MTENKAIEGFSGDVSIITNIKNKQGKIQNKDEVNHVVDDNDKKKPKLLHSPTNNPRSGIITLYLFSIRTCGCYVWP